MGALCSNLCILCKDATIHFYIFKYFYVEMKQLEKFTYVRVIIIAILVALALTFRQALTNYAQSVMDYVFDEGKVIGQI